MSIRIKEGNLSSSSQSEGPKVPSASPSPPHAFWYLASFQRFIAMIPTFPNKVAQIKQFSNEYFMASLKMNIANSRKSLLYFCLFQDQRKLGTLFKGINFPGWEEFGHSPWHISLVTPCPIRSDSATVGETWRGITAMARLTVWKASTYLFHLTVYLGRNSLVTGKVYIKMSALQLTFRYPCLNLIKILPERGHKIYFWARKGKKQKKAKQMFWGKK